MSTWVEQTFTAFASGSSSWTAGVGTPTQDNLLLLYIISDETQVISTGSTTGSPTVTGWTELHSGVAKTAGGDCSGYLFYKIAGASESDATITWSGTPQGTTHVVEVSGVDTVSPINGSNYNTTGAGATSVVITGITTTDDGCLLVCFAGVDESNPNYAPYWADPMVSGWTARYGSSSVPNTVGGSSTYTGIASTTQVTAGATGDVTATIDIENDAIVAFLVAVTPSTGGPVSLQTNQTGNLGFTFVGNVVSSNNLLVGLLAN